MGREDVFGVKSRKHKGDIVILKKDSELYGKMKDLTRSERAVLDFLIREMAKHMNTVTIGGETRELLISEVGISTGTISNVLSKLKDEGFIDKTVLPNEYLVSPSLAVNGSESAVYRYMARLEEELKSKRG